MYNWYCTSSISESCSINRYKLSIFDLGSKIYWEVRKFKEKYYTSTLIINGHSDNEEKAKEDAIKAYEEIINNVT